MAESFHVNGPAIICVGVGSGGALARLGVSVDGVDVFIEQIREDCPTDVTGGTGPADEQHFMEVAVISFTLAVYDESVLDAYHSKTIAGVTFPPGTMPPSGVLLGASGNYKTLAIASPNEGRPYTFPFSALAAGRSKEERRGTKRSLPRITVRAIPNIGAALTSAGAVLYHRNAFTVP